MEICNLSKVDASEIKCAEPKPTKKRISITNCVDVRNGPEARARVKQILKANNGNVSKYFDPIKIWGAVRAKAVPSV